MIFQTLSKRILPLLALLAVGVRSHGGNLDTVGVTLLRQFDPTLQGAGLKIAQVEALESETPPAFEVNPAATGQPLSLFSFISGLGSSSLFPNSVGAESGHADGVADHFFGTANGVAPQISHVDNYEAEFFFTNVILSLTNLENATRIINQSFIFEQNSAVEQKYDDYATKYNVLFVSGASFNAAQVHPAASCYNGLGVGVSDVANPPFGPTLDGRCKPDIVAPGLAASFSTPYVAGSAVLLLQAALRGDAGTNSFLATNLITLKALLLNGALKPTSWTNSPTSPLDLQFGAGVVNVFNSWTQLKAGQRAPIETTSVNTNTPPSPGNNLTNLASLVGWDYRGITNSTSTDKINHYYFNLAGNDAYTLTATLIWNRHQNKTNINDLNLFLFDTSSSNLIAASVSPVDNTEHLSLPRLKPGRYDLQVVKTGSATQVSSGETYALAFEIFKLALQITPVNSDSLAITWPAAPTGFTLYSTTSLTSPVSWTPVNAAVNVDTNTAQNSVVLPVGNTNLFFRLQRP